MHVFHAIAKVRHLLQLLLVYEYMAIRFGKYLGNDILYRMGSDRNLNKIDESLKELDATYVSFSNFYKEICGYIKILPLL